MRGGTMYRSWGHIQIIHWTVCVAPLPFQGLPHTSTGGSNHAISLEFTWLESPGTKWAKRPPLGFLTWDQRVAEILRLQTQELPQIRFPAAKCGDFQTWCSLHQEMDQWSLLLNLGESFVLTLCINCGRSGSDILWEKTMHHSSISFGTPAFEALSCHVRIMDTLRLLHQRDYTVVERNVTGAPAIPAPDPQCPQPRCWYVSKEDGFNQHQTGPHERTWAWIN